MRCDQLQPSWKPSFLCCSECSCKIGEYAPDLISCSRVRSEDNMFLGVRFCVVLPGTFNRKRPYCTYLDLGTPYVNLSTSLNIGTYLNMRSSLTWLLAVQSNLFICMTGVFSFQYVCDRKLYFNIIKL